MTDAFSGATTTKEGSMTDAQITQAEKYMLDGTVLPEFKDNIRWDWVIEEVEIL